MKMKSSSFLVMVILSILVISASAIVGGWRKIEDLKAPEVVKMAEFAVAEHNRVEKTRLNLVRVLDGETQVVSGVKYRLLLAAGAGNYTAVVWSKPWQKIKQLLSFDKTPAS